jgi:hypothetical protein
VGPRLLILGIANPVQPTLIGQISALPGLVKDIAVYGSYAYVACYDSGLHIVDVSDPAHPAEIGSYDAPGLAEGVAVSSSYAYVADNWEGLRIINISDPTRPSEVGFYDTPGGAADVAVSGSYAYVAD